MIVHRTPFPEKSGKGVFAGQGDAGPGSAVDSYIGAMKGEDDQKVSVGNEPYNHEIDRLHRVIEKNARDTLQWRKEWYKHNQEKVGNIDDIIGYPGYDAFRKQGTTNNKNIANTADGTWVTATVDSSGDVGKYTSIALDTSGKAHISYYDYDTSYLKYATNGSGAWVTATVGSDSYPVGKFNSIALDTSGKAHISYYDGYNDDLKYATNAVDENCTAELIKSSKTKLKLKKNASKDVTITVTGKDGCLVEGETATGAINKAGRKYVSVSPKSQSTDVNGQVVFKVKAKDSTGNAVITVKAGSLKKRVRVTVVE